MLQITAKVFPGKSYMDQDAFNRIYEIDKSC